MNLKILCFGKLDQKFYLEAFNFYQQKIQKKINFEVIELKEYFHAETKVNILENMKLLENKLQNYSNYEKILLNVKSKMIDSKEFASLIQNNRTFKNGNLILIIGPSDGFSEEFIKQYPGISFGKITFPHQLFRLVLVEQIYRSLKILNHEKYHK